MKEISARGLDCFYGCKEWRGSALKDGGRCHCHLCKEDYILSPFMTMKFLKASGCNALEDLRWARSEYFRRLNLNEGYYLTC